MSRVLDEWEMDLTPIHRALLALCRERTTHAEHALLEGMGESQLAGMLRDFLREEYVTIPAGTPVVSCRWCNARVCWVVFHDRHHRSSFVVDGSECVAPTATEPGYGFHHIAACGGLVQMANARYVASEPIRQSPQRHEAA